MLRRPDDEPTRRDACIAKSRDQVPGAGAPGGINQNQIETEKDSHLWEEINGDQQPGNTRPPTGVVRPALAPASAYLVLRDFDYHFGPKPDDLDYRHYVISKARLFLGSEERTDIRISYRDQKGRELVSARHAGIEVADDGHYLWDLMSTNGTFLNGKQLGRDTDSRVKLSDHDKIQIRPYTFEFLEVQR